MSVRTGMLCLLFASAAYGQSVRDYNVVWTTPSEGPKGSMPLGNGDISVNAWIEPGGDLVLYIGKTDSWGDNGRLLKVGRLRVELEPNPLRQGVSFRQTLDLERAEMRVEIGEDLVLRLWVDACSPVIHVTAESSQDLTATARIELWRNEPHELPSIEVSDVLLRRSGWDSGLDKDDLERYQRYSKTVVEPDTILPDQQGRIGWYHHNVKSVGPELTMRIQGLYDATDRDPLLHRTFGAVVTSRDGKRIDGRTLRTGRGRELQLHVYVLTEHPATPPEWLEAVERMIDAVERTPFRDHRDAHQRWWRRFWSRSWIHVREADPRPPALVPTNDHPLRLGADQAGHNRFRGSLGRISVLAAALDEKEIAALARGPRGAFEGKAALVGSWNDVEPGHAVPKSESGPFAGPLTVEAWIEPGELPAGGARIVDKITPGGSDGFLLDTFPGNSLRLIARAGILAKRDVLTRGSWHHVAATIDPKQGRLRLYLDGKLIAEETTEALSDAFVVSRGYHLQRFITAGAGRGRYPIKFNGSLFTVPHPGAPGDADYRRWGPGYWWQNTRLPYISLCTSGDFDLMGPFFHMYTGKLMEVSRRRTQRSFGHPGAFLPECVYFWGAVFTETYGWQPFEKRADKLQKSGWHKWEWVAGLELVWMLLDRYEHTLDVGFLRERVLPTAQEVLTFFDRHYTTDERGKLVMQPAQALETWWDCVNPMSEVAGLRAVLARLLALPERLTNRESRGFWKTLLAKVPELPTREVDGARMLAPAEKFANKRNIENPELYAVFPFRLVGVGRGDLELGRNALEHRWDRGASGWRQDDIFMAYLGLAEAAKRNLVSRARSKDRGSRFPAFWGPNYDWIPDQDHGGILMKALQAMLLQTDGDRIHLLPAWPRGWNATFKLHAPRRTVLEGEVKDGRLARLRVTPERRRKDVIVH